MFFFLAMQLDRLGFFRVQVQKIIICVYQSVSQT